MKAIYNTVIFQVCSILLFGILYWIYKDDFTVEHQNNRQIQILDCMYTSVTIQAGVGASIIAPKTNTVLCILMIQQLSMIFSNVLILFLFSIYLLSTHHKYHK